MEMLIGNVTADAKVFTTKGNKDVVKFSIAIDKSYNSKTQGRVKKTLYVECSFWNRSKLAQYITKGIAVMIEGDLGAEAYLNKAGQPMASVTMSVKQLSFINSKSSKQPARELTQPIEDLPF